MSAHCRGILTALCLGTLATCGGKPPAPEVGVDLYAVPPENVTEILLSSPTKKVYAYRWGQGSPFQVWTASSNSADAEQCKGGEGLRRWLEAISTVRLVREVDPPWDRSAPNWSDILIRDATNLEPIQVRVRIPASDGEPVVIDSHGRQFAAQIDARVLRTVMSGCSQLK